jgi:hemolysin III
VKQFREPFNGLSHLVGAYVALGGMILLVARAWYEPEKRVSLAVYGASLTLMLAASAAYHSVQCDPRRVFRFRRIDHAAIYVLIAGTYTPLCINLFSGFWEWGMLAVIWGVAIAGSMVKAFHISKSDWFFVAVYLGAGWLSLLAIREIFRVMPPGAIAWLLGGGAFYTLGAVLLAGKRLDFKPGVFGHHEVWHIFVGAAAFCHFMLMWKYVA